MPAKVRKNFPKSLNGMPHRQHRSKKGQDKMHKDTSPRYERLRNEMLMNEEEAQGYDYKHIRGISI